MSINIDTKNCDECGTCVSVCASDALMLTEVLRVDTDKCTSCGVCVTVCPIGALQG